MMKRGRAGRREGGKEWPSRFPILDIIMSYNFSFIYSNFSIFRT